MSTKIPLTPVGALCIFTILRSYQCDYRQSTCKIIGFIYQSKKGVTFLEK